MILLHCELERYDGIFLIRALSSEVKADVNFPLYQRSVKIVDIFFYILAVWDNNECILWLLGRIFVSL